MIRQPLLAALMAAPLLFVAPFAIADANETETLEIMWEDLMPEGEEERLVELYNEFYEELEAQWANAEQMSLSEAGAMGIEEGSAADFMPQIGTFNTVAELDGASIRMPGYIVPLAFDERETYTEFLLVPYFGACLHSPPPPPNQIVYVTANPAVEIKSIYDPVWTEGVLSAETNENETGDAAYTLTLSKLEPYEW